MPDKQTKKTQPRTKTRELIIAEAERLIAERGIDKLKLDDIAQSLGIQRPTLYFHFKGRQGILTEIAERGTIQLCDQFQDDENQDPITAISNGVEEMTQYMREHRAFTLLMARNHSTPEGLPAFNSLPGGTKRKTVPLVAEQLFERIGRIIERGCQNGDFEPMDAELFWSITLSSIGLCVIYPGWRIPNLKKKMVKYALGLLSKQP